MQIQLTSRPRISDSNLKFLKKLIITSKIPISTHLTSKSKQCHCDLRDILLLPKIDSLEDIQVSNSVLLDSLLEYIDIFHHFERCTGCVDFWNWSWLNFIHELAENDAVLECTFVWFTWWEFGTENCFNPFLGFLFLFCVALTSELWVKWMLLALFLNYFEVWWIGLHV